MTAPSASTAAGLEFCDLCQRETAAVPLYRVGKYSIVRCAECALTFMSPRSLATTTVQDIYSAAYFEGGVADGYVDYSATEEVLRHQARRSLKAIQRHQLGGRLLEVGCAYGFFLSEAQSAFTVEGIEISAHAADCARQRGLAVKCEDLLAASLPDASYDVVCLYDCIEHLTKPFSYLNKVAALLKPGGVVTLTTGDIGSTWARLCRKRWRLMTPPQHLFYFSKQSLTGLLERAGFEVLEVSYPWKYVPLKLILYQISPALEGHLKFLSRLPVGLYVNLFDALQIIARKSNP